MKKIIQIVFLIVFFTSCKIEPKEIDFGLDACHFCKMTIVDKAFASEIVSTKGKIYKYDAIECMIKNQDVQNLNAALFLVYDYEYTADFIDATKSFFVISDHINSPMGENLGAFLSKASAEKFVKVNGGIQFNWTEINTHFNTQNVQH